MKCQREKCQYWNNDGYCAEDIDCSRNEILKDMFKYKETTQELMKKLALKLSKKGVKP